MSKLVIGLTAFAKTGKDCFCNSLRSVVEEEYGGKFQRVALADPLKEEMKDFFLCNFGINIHNCKNEQKELLRPLLVAYGKAKRIQTNGTYFWHKAKNTIESSDADVFVVTDIRYDQYERDEYFFIRSFSNNLFLGLSRDGVIAPNEDELEEIPKLIEKADQEIKLPNFKNDIDIHTKKLILDNNLIREKLNVQFKRQAR